MKKRLKSKITVVVQPQTIEEDRLFRSSLSLLMTEIVRQHISGLRSNHEHTK